MDRKRGIRSNIVPGRRPITKIAALHDVGIGGNLSYMDEKTFMEESSHMNDTADVEEREWRQQMLSENEIQRRFEARKQKQLKDAHDRLKKEKYGAKGFDELLKVSQYNSGRESDGNDDDEDYHNENENNSGIQVFAIPALPKHISEGSIMGSPVAGSKGSGKAGLSCSTPKSGNDVSMRSLRSLDISHVVSTDQLDAFKTTTQTKNIVVSTAKSREDSSLQKTHTIGKEESSQRQTTFTVAKDSEGAVSEVHSVTRHKDDSSIQKTFIVSGKPTDEQTSSSLQKTFTVAERPDDEKTFIVNEEDGKETESPLQATFVLSNPWSDSLISSGERTKAEMSKVVESTDKTEKDASPKSVQRSIPNVRNLVQDDEPTVENSMQGGEKRRSNQVVAQKREKRGANMSNSLMASMIEDVPSPGANYFKNPRKKLRNIVVSPSKAKAITRLSTESDKEKTIDMLSIAEEASIDSDSIASSFVDPVSINGTRVSPVPEIEEPMEVMNSTPKSSRRGTGFSIRDSLMEKARGGILCSTPTAPIVDNVSPAATPKLNYQRPTLSSILKSKGAPDNNGLLNAVRREHRTPVHKVVETSLRQSPISDLSTNSENDQEAAGLNKTTEEAIGQVQEPINLTYDIAHQPPNDIDLAISAITLQSGNSNQHANYDYDIDYEPAQYSDEVERNESESGPSTRRKTRRAALLSDSIATVNTPGVDRRPTRHIPRNDTISEDSSFDEETEEKSKRRTGRHGQGGGLQLKKRKIIQPVTPDVVGVRRSQRNRVKTVRSWLGERVVYTNSPSGGQRLTSVTNVFIKDKRLCKYKTADLKLATEREQKEKAYKKKLAAMKREQLTKDQQNGRRLNESQEDIYTDDD